MGLYIKEYVYIQNIIKIQCQYSWYEYIKTKRESFCKKVFLHMQYSTRQHCMENDWISIFLLYVFSSFYIMSTWTENISVQLKLGCHPMPNTSQLLLSLRKIKKQQLLCKKKKQWLRHSFWGRDRFPQRRSVDAMSTIRRSFRARISSMFSALIA